MHLTWNAISCCIVFNGVLSTVHAKRCDSHSYLSLLNVNQKVAVTWSLGLVFCNGNLFLLRKMLPEKNFSMWTNAKWQGWQHCQDEFPQMNARGHRIICTGPHWTHCFFFFPPLVFSPLLSSQSLGSGRQVPYFSCGIANLYVRSHVHRYTLYSSWEDIVNIVTWIHLLTVSSETWHLRHYFLLVHPIKWLGL